MEDIEPTAFQAAPPVSASPTDYDWAHRIAYLRLLDANAEGADWREAARIVMGIDPDAAGAEAQWRAHLNRAIWMTEHGYRAYLGMRPDGSSDKN